jgi:hypothetical protein
MIAAPTLAAAQAMHDMPGMKMPATPAKKAKKPAAASAPAPMADMKGMDMPASTPPPVPSQPVPNAAPMPEMKGMNTSAATPSPGAPSAPAAPMAGMDMSGAHHDRTASDHSMAGMKGMAGMDMGSMRGALANYSMMRDASGTAWQPDSSPMEGIHGQSGPWSTMLHGNLSVVYDNQGGPRGTSKTFSESMLMGMAQRPLDGGTLTLRAMGSLDPFMGKSGYPLLLQTGETANGKTELIDRQHPHDLFMELAGAYSHPLGEKLSGFVYVGYPGEPALGPATFMHRFSGMASPEAPIGHHWLDSTHITFGVLTGGVAYDRLKLEASSFTGREPDQHRFNFDRPKFDSWSVRATWNPTDDLSMQVSYGHLNSPEQLTPNVNQDRTTASATYNRPINGGNWQTTLAWGRDVNNPGRTTNAWLLDSAVSKGRHTIFGRAENVDKDELFDDQPTNPLYGRSFNVSKLSVGYYYTAPIASHLGVDVGGLVSKYALPSALNPTYGSNPTSFMLFARVKIQ